MKRFYKHASVAEVAGGFQVQLDGRPIKTALGAAQVVASRALAETLAAEWNAQGETLDTALFRFRDHADYAIDIVRSDRGGTITRLLQYAETDTLCYRADPDEHFFRRQHDVWEPLLSAFEQREGIAMQRVSGIIHRAQSALLHEKLSGRLEKLGDFPLAALLALTSLSASLCIGLSALEADADADALWNAANFEEDWQVEQWGEDFEATAVRQRRTQDFQTAWEFYQLVK
ncbi:MAG: ATP12 family protein [Pontixanthobacter sp.]